MGFDANTVWSRVAEFLAYNPETGMITWIKTHPGRASGTIRIGSEAGGVHAHSGYRTIRFMGRLLKAHAVAWDGTKGCASASKLDDGRPTSRLRVGRSTLGGSTTRLPRPHAYDAAARQYFGEFAKTNFGETSNEL